MSVLTLAKKAIDRFHEQPREYKYPGVRAAMDGRRHGIIDHWLQPIRDVADLHGLEGGEGEDAEARLNRLCELSIQAQVESLARTPIIQSAWNRGR